MESAQWELMNEDHGFVLFICVVAFLWWLVSTCSKDDTNDKDIEI